MATWVSFTTLQAKGKKGYVFSRGPLCSTPFKKEIGCTYEWHFNRITTILNSKWHPFTGNWQRSSSLLCVAACRGKDEWMKLLVLLSDKTPKMSVPLLYWASSKLQNSRRRDISKKPRQSSREPTIACHIWTWIEWIGSSGPRSSS